MPITPGGGDASKNVEYVYLGCSSNTDISTAKLKYQLSTPNPGVSSFRRLYPLVNNKIGQNSYEFVFTEAGIFFIDFPLQAPNQIKIYTLNGYRTGGLKVDDLTGYEIFCDKDNNILYAENRTNILTNGGPIFFAFSTNIPIS